MRTKTAERKALTAEAKVKKSSQAIWKVTFKSGYINAPVYEPSFGISPDLISALRSANRLKAKHGANMSVDKIEFIGYVAF